MQIHDDNTAKILLKFLVDQKKINWTIFNNQSNN